MLHICLIEPEIPQNTGNIARTVAATNSELILVHPLGFDISEKAVRRSGLDYWKDVKKRKFSNKEEFFDFLKDKDTWFFTSHTDKFFSDVKYSADVYLVFGKESVGLGEEIINTYKSRCLRIPMYPDERCLNLSNAVAVATYEVFRQWGYRTFV